MAVFHGSYSKTRFRCGYQRDLLKCFLWGVPSKELSEHQCYKTTRKESAKKHLLLK